MTRSNQVGEVNVFMNMVIRKAQLNDVEAIVSILNHLIEAGSHTSFDTLFTNEFEREFILSFPERGVFHVALNRSDERITGFQSMKPFEGNGNSSDHVGVIGTYVDLAYPRQDVAQCLFAATYEVARANRYEKIIAYIRADDEAGVAMYLQEGFRIVGTLQRQIKIKNTYIDDVVVEKLLQK